MILSFLFSDIKFNSTVDIDAAVVDSLLQPFVTSNVIESEIPLYYYGIDAFDLSDYVSVSQPDFGNNKVRSTIPNIISVNTSNVTVTDVVNSYVDETIPLWWEHHSTSNTLVGTASPISKVLFDDELVEVDQRLWKYDTVLSALYSNIKNHIDPNTEQNVVYYVQTTYDDGQVTTELLNAQPVFRRSASPAVSKKYNISASSSDIVLSIFGHSGLIYVRENIEDSFDIKIYGGLNSSVWNMAVKNDLVQIDGSVYSIGGSYYNAGTFYRDVGVYKVFNRRIDILSPSLLFVDIPGRLITEGEVKLVDGTISANNLKYNIVVRDSSGNLKAMYTNYEPAGLTFQDNTGVVEAEFAINSISPDGYIKLFGTLDPDDIIDITGTFVSDYYIDSENIKYSSTTSFRLFSELYVNGSSEELQKNPSSLVNLSQIGTVSVNKDTDFTEVSLLDVRQRGGGINEEYQQIVEDSYPESIFYRDINTFASADFMMSAGLIVNTPGNLVLDQFNGELSKENVSSLVQDSMLAGVGAITRQYNIAPILLDISYGSTPSPFATLTWKDISTFSYRAHLSYDGHTFDLVFPSQTTLLPETSSESYSGEYQYNLFYDPPSSGNSLMYVKIEGVYTAPDGTVVDNNFSKTYRLKRI